VFEDYRDTGSYPINPSVIIEATLFPVC